MKKLYIPKSKIGYPSSNEIGEGMYDVDIIDINQTVLIMGPNGVGKTELGKSLSSAFPLSEYYNKIRFIHASRALIIPDIIPLKSLKEAQEDFNKKAGEKNLIKEDVDDEKRISFRRKKNMILNDFTECLSLLLAREMNKSYEYFQQVKKGIDKDIPISHTTDLDKVAVLWQTIFPDKIFRLKDQSLSFKYLRSYLNKSMGLSRENGKSEGSMSANELSHGEKVVLYFIAQCICAPEGSVLIIDEPELHIHKSVVQKLFNELEKARQDCTFIYITHDIFLAKQKEDAKIIFVKGFDGFNWEWEELFSLKQIPSEALIEILGEKKKILFIEGDSNSIDSKIYANVFPEFKLIPVGSCEKVIDYVKSLRNNSDLHNYDIYGIIDRDYRPENEVNKLKKSNVIVLEVAEAESLLLTEEILHFLTNHLAIDELVIDKIKNKVFKALEKEIQNEKQPTNLTAKRVKYKLGEFKVSYRSKEALSKNFLELIDGIDINRTYDESKEIFDKIISEKKYNDALKYYNRKTLASDIAKYFGLTSSEYNNTVLRLLKKESTREYLIAKLKQYIPLKE